VKTKIREYRNQAGMTQQELADAVHVSSRTIISIEKGQYNPSLMLAYRLARAFATTVEDICQLEANKRLDDEENGYA
jgi:putative transcriptional regulator